MIFEEISAVAPYVGQGGRVGASTLKWTCPNPCLVSTENDSKVYTNFDFFGEKNHRNFYNIFTYKAKKLMMTKKKLQESLHILEDGASGVQVGDSEEVTVQNLFKVR